jgi:lipopolysaccharide biosynthesis regulator YciM
LIIILIFNGLNLHAQVFPEVSTPAQQEKQVQQENEKLAFYYYGEKEYEKALELFQGLYSKTPSSHYYTYILYCMTALNRYSEAEKLVRNKMKDEPGSARYEIDLGYVYLLSDKPEKATKIFDETIDKMKPNRANINELANAFTNRQQYDYAIKTYLKGKAILQGTYSFNQELARTYEISGNYEAMIEEYLDLLQTDPSQLDMVQNRFQSALSKDIDNKISDMLRQSLLKRNQRNPENRNYSEMLLWLSVQQKDFEFALIQARSIDTRFNEGGILIFSVANLSLSNQDYDVAIDAFNILIKKGPANPYYSESLTGLLQAKFLKITQGYVFNESDLISLKEEYLQALNELGRNSRTIILMKDLAHLEAFYLDELEEAITLLEEALEIGGVQEMTKAQIKLELGDIYLFTGEEWEASLLYSQVEKAFKSEPTGHEAKLRNARLSYYIGEFGWAKAQLDVLKAATSKLIANDAMELSLLISDNMDPDSTYTTLAYYARADLFQYRGQDSLALLTLDSIKTLGLYHPLDDEVLNSKAGIFIKQKKYEEADTALATIVKDYKFDILADNALFKRAELQAEVMGNKTFAMELYQQLMLDYPGSLFTTEARKRYRQLRGDYIN